RPMLATLDRITWVDRVQLPRLTSHDTAELAADILGRQLAADLADTLYRRTEGNPLFVETLLGRDGELYCELPESLRDLLLDAVRRLPEDTQEVLRVASAGGETTGHALLAGGAGVDGPGAAVRAPRPGRRGPARRAPPGGNGQRPARARRRLHVPARADPRGGARGPAARRARPAAHAVGRGHRRGPAP